MYTVEATDREPGGNRPPLRRATQDACTGELASAFATAVADLALPLFPFCAALDPDQHRAAASRLQACGSLAGDRVAAAQALNQATKLARVRRAEDAVLLRGLIDYRAVIDWNGEEVGGEENRAMAFWLQRMTGSDSPVFYVVRATGENAERVRVEGSLVRTVESEGAPGKREIAPITLMFVSPHYNLGFRVERATVGAFQPTAR